MGIILGIDEVGRGPWAGPLVIGAVILPDVFSTQLTDSKKLSPKKRTELAAIINDQASATSLGWVSAQELDQIGLSEALKLATRRALEQISAPFHEIIIDGTVNFLKSTPLEHHVTTLKKADLLIPAVSAASIIAKVARDRYMADLISIYPHHGFEKHVGYGTPAHRTAIITHGLTPEHRHSFRPVAELAGLKPNTPATSQILPRTTTQTGNIAETKVANYLETQGHTIICRNWKTRMCEIDIISQQGDIIYFTEVKYRKKPDTGDGLSAITPQKLKQISFAAETYLSYHKITNQSLLQIASVSGPTFTIDTLLPLL